MLHFEEIFQGASLLVLAVTVFVSFRQLKAATEQARASNEQAKASEKMARLSLEQTELMRAQIHASFRPVITVEESAYGPNSANLILKNIGAGPAIGVVGIYRSGARQSVGSVAVEQTVPFRFDNYLNVIQRPVGPIDPMAQATIDTKPTTALRLEYESITGAKCWTAIDFPLGHEGSFVPETEHGIAMPSLDFF